MGAQEIARDEGQRLRSFHSPVRSFKYTIFTLLRAFTNKYIYILTKNNSKIKSD